MALIGFHASHEQFTPRELLDCVVLAEPGPGEAALQATEQSFGVVTVPGGWRYHPAILAQAAATLCQLFPGRFWMAPGSGERMNEQITGERWPLKEERNRRLQEGVRIMRALWAGEEVSSREPIPVDGARLYTRAQEPPPLIGAALTPRTARWLAGWADGLITVNAPPGKLREIMAAFREGGGEGKPVYLQVHLSWAADEGEALRQAHEQWRSNIFASHMLAELRTPEEFEAAAEFVRPEDMRGPVLVSSDIERQLDWLQELLELGVDGLYLHQVGTDQRGFIDVFGERVLPRLQAG